VLSLNDGLSRVVSLVSLVPGTVRCLAPFLIATAVSCGGAKETEPPVATPAFSVNHPRAALGSPVEITYRFTVAADAPKFQESYRAMVHFLDADEELMWTDDHVPEPPTTDWKPGQTVEYKRTMFVPIYPYIGEATIQMGLYSTTTNKRLPLAGEDSGQRAYRVGTMQLLPQTENVFLIFKDGWHPTEIAENNPTVEWQWTKKEATLQFRNPRKTSVFYLHLDHPGGVFTEPQQVEVTMGSRPIDSFGIKPNDELIRKVTLTPEQLGTADMVEIKVVVDKTFVPALLPAASSRDPRELGVRVFHAFVEPQ
jgi:hypothetical protein